MKNMKKLLQKAMVFTLSAAMLVGTPLTASAAGLVDLYSIEDGSGNKYGNDDGKPTGTITNTDTNTGVLISRNEAKIVGIALDREVVNAEKWEEETLKATVVLDGKIEAADNYYDSYDSDGKPNGKLIISKGADITQKVVDELSKKIKWEVIYTDAEGNVIPKSKNLPLPSTKVSLAGNSADRSVITLVPQEGTVKGQEVTVRASIDASYYFTQNESGNQGISDKKLWIDDENFKQDDARKGTFYKADAKVSVKEYATGLKWNDAGQDENPKYVYDRMNAKHTLDLSSKLERDPATANDDITWTSSDTRVATVSAAGVVTAKAVGNTDKEVKITAVSEHGAMATRHITVSPGTKADVVKIVDVSGAAIPNNKIEKDLANERQVKLKAEMYAKVEAYADSDKKAVVPDGAADGTALAENVLTALGESAAVTKNIEVKNGDLYVDKDGNVHKVEITDEITWTSNKAAVAAVADGTVTLRSVGTAVVTAKATNGKSAKVTVKVNATLGTLTISGQPTEAYSGRTYNLVATKNVPENTDAVKWAVALLNEDGTTAKTTEATINAKGVLTIKNQVTDGAKIQVTLETAKQLVTNADGSKSPIKATPVTITLKQSNIDTITVEDDEKNPVAYGGFDAAGKKIVKGKGLKSETSEINVPLKRAYVASTTSGNVKGDASQLTWKTSNAKIAALSTTAGGKVEITAVGSGTATITVSGVRVVTNATTNKKTASVISVNFKVKVKQPVTTLTMNKPNVTLAVKKNAQGKELDQPVSGLKVTFGPKKADKDQAKIASWTVYKNGKPVDDANPIKVKNKDVNVTTASLTYKLTAPKAGEVYTITAKSVTGATATSTVTIVDKTAEVAIVDKTKLQKNADDTVISYERFSAPNKAGKLVDNTAELTIGAGKALQMETIINIGETEKKKTEDKPTKWVLPGTNDAEQVTYTVNKKGIVNVDSQGRVYAVKKGTVTITAKTPTNKKATLKVTVVDPE